MNLFQVILKQMRQRFLSTILTILSILLGMALATSIMIIHREGRQIFAQTDYGCDLVVGPKGSPLQLVMNTLYHMDVSPGNISYKMYEDMVSGSPTTVDGKKNEYRGLVLWAVPYCVGDSYQGRRIVGTTSQLFGVMDDGTPYPDEKIPEYRKGERYHFADGHPFNGNKFEAVIGAEVARGTGLHVGSTFHATHGFPSATDIPDVHPETWTVVGVLAETHTSNDRVLFIPLKTFYAIFEHESGLEAINQIQNNATGAQPTQAPAPVATVPATEEENPHEGYTLNADGTLNNKLPKSEWEVSAILVKTRSPSALLQMQFLLRSLPEAVGVNPASIMREFFDTFLAGTFQLLYVISSLVLVVGGVSILVSIYNSVTGRMREIAIMRALGATREKILAIVCLEAGLVGLIGGILGLFVGHAIAALGSTYLQQSLGTGIGWYRFGPEELLYLGIVVVVSLLAGLVPAMKAYRTPVAENLVAN